MKTLEQKIRQLVPSLQELTMGCEAMQDGIKVVFNKSYKYFDNNYYESKNDRGNTVMAHFDEILGHPITLAEVLQAIALTIGDEYAWEQAIDTTGQFRTDWGDKRHEGSGIYWDLTLPLSGQSEEVVKFLNEVLK